MKLTSSPDVPDGEIRGYSATGALIVQKAYMPNFKRLMGTEEDEERVVEWRMSDAGMRRLVAIQTWAHTGNYTRGSC